MTNTDQKTIESYEQLLNYILKYVMKPEKASEFLSNMIRSIMISGGAGEDGEFH